MLYNGCLKFINMAKIAVDKNDIQEKNTNIQKAQNIISELMVTLNMDMEISKNMMALYDFALRRLVEANIRNDRSEEHTSELQSRENLVCRLLLEKKKKKK